MVSWSSLGTPRDVFFSLQRVVGEQRVLFVKTICLSSVKVMSISAMNARNGCTAFLTFPGARDTDIIYSAIIASYHRAAVLFKEIESMLWTIKPCYPPSEGVLWYLIFS